MPAWIFGFSAAIGILAVFWLIYADTRPRSASSSPRVDFDAYKIRELQIRGQYSKIVE
jgi:hypothetical protein